MPLGSRGAWFAAWTLLLVPALLHSQPSTSRLEADRGWWYEVGAGTEFKCPSCYEGGRAIAVRLSARHQFHPSPIRIGLSAWMLRRNVRQYHFSGSGPEWDRGTIYVLGGIVSADAEIPLEDHVKLIPKLGVGLAPWAGYSPGTYSDMRTKGSGQIWNGGISLRIRRVLFSWDYILVWDEGSLLGHGGFSPLTVSWRF